MFQSDYSCVKCIAWCRSYIVWLDGSWYVFMIWLDHGRKLQLMTHSTEPWHTMTMNQKPNWHKLFQTIYFSCHFLCSWWSHLWCLEDSINSQPSSCFGETRWNNSSIASRDIGRKVCERRQVIRRSLENSWPMDPMKLERPPGTGLQIWPHQSLSFLRERFQFIMTCEN